MCFSAAASFTASSVLSLIGITALLKTQGNKRLLPIAVIPLIFGIQQAAEGIVWLGIYHNRADIITFFSYIFLGITMIGWPVIVPYTVYQLEQNKKRKQMLKYLFFIGMVIASTLIGALLMIPLRVMVHHHHIVYDLPMTVGWSWFATFWYIAVTVVPTFISTRPYAWLLGVILSCSYIISFILFSYAHISIWCFIVALLSVLILLLLNDKRKSE